MNRRGFLRGMAGILAAGVAPAVIPSGILMPVRTLWKPSALGPTIFDLRAMQINDLQRWYNLARSRQLVVALKKFTLQEKIAA